MTQREFFTKVIETSTDEIIINFAKEAVAKLDKRNKDKADKDTDKKVAIRELAKRIVAYLADHPKAIGKTIAEALGAEQAKVVGVCGVLANEGTISKVEVSIPKVGKRVGYILNTSAETTAESDEGAESAE